jgi:hypothetical protein
LRRRGFHGYEQTGLSLNANQVISVDAQLTVAAQTTETVQVIAATPVIDTETGTMSYVKTSRDLEQLPLVVLAIVKRRPLSDGIGRAFAYTGVGDPPRGGRPKIREEFRTLIRTMVAENSDWGAPRIHGELLTAHKPTRQA